jgi:hypothetical protein
MIIMYRVKSVFEQSEDAIADMPLGSIRQVELFLKVVDGLRQLGSLRDW